MDDLLRDRVVAAIGDVYEIRKELGRGGMSVVYDAIDVRLRREVAIKVLPPDLAFRADVRTRFLREAETAAQLSHPNIIPIYSVDERAGIVFFVMELIDGESLGARLARDPRPPFGDVVRILRSVAAALAYAHSHGVIHRDIKPDNILLHSRDKRPVVTDFGIARALEADARLTATGIAVGTPAYMSPEQAMGERDVDGRSDIYSLGVVGYQMVTGNLPFEGSSTTAMMLKHLNHVPQPLREVRPDVPAALASAIDRALSKARRDRWHDAAAFASALGGGGDAGIAPVSRPRGHPSRATDAAEPAPKRGLDQRILDFRRHLAGYGTTVAILAGVNALTTPFFPWFLFAAVPMGGRVARDWTDLANDGVTLKQVLKREGNAVARDGRRKARAKARVLSQEAYAAKVATPDVLAGPHGNSVRHAVADREAILAIIESLAAPDRALLPDITPTVDALIERAATLAQMLHNLDAGLSADTAREVDARIRVLEREPKEATDRARRLELLTRQRATLADLAGRREATGARLDRTLMALQSLKLDLLKLRSAGVQAAIDDVTGATREARAVSNEIARVIDAASEMRDLN